MEESTNQNSISFSDQSVKYERQDKVPTHEGFPQDSSSELLDFADKKENWISLKEKSFEVSHKHTVSAFDVAAYILKKLGRPMTTMKLQKLVYYCQAWSLVWDERPLFRENIEAWANGPVVRELFNYHRGQYTISAVAIGNPDLLDKNQKETIDAVLDYYGNKPSQWLSDLTHMEDPWRLTRTGLPEMQRGSRVIGLDVISEYYGSLPPETEK